MFLDAFVYADLRVRDGGNSSHGDMPKPEILFKASDGAFGSRTHGKPVFIALFVLALKAFLELVQRVQSGWSRWLRPLGVGIAPHQGAV